MTPGADVPVYGRFPTELDTNPAGIMDLDRYYQDSLTLACGKENIGLQVPPDMGSNRVGGGRRKTHKKRRGGGMFDFLSGNIQAVTPTNDPFTRPYIASVYPNTLQRAYTEWSGIPDKYPAPAAPEDHTWKYESNGTMGAINPSAFMK